MANYNAYLRTNYFSVADEEKFRKIFDNVQAGDNIEIFETEKNGEKQFGFGLYGSIYGLSQNGDDGPEPSIEDFWSALQEVLIQGDAILITEVGYENLRYLTGFCHVITKTDIMFVDLNEKSLETARTLLGDPQYQTQMDY